MCALDPVLKAPKHSPRSTRGYFCNACEVYWKSVGGTNLLPEAAEFDLLFAGSNGKYIYCRWSVLAMGKNSQWFGVKFSFFSVFSEAFSTGDGWDMCPFFFADKFLQGAKTVPVFAAMVSLFRAATLWLVLVSGTIQLCRSTITYQHLRLSRHVLFPPKWSLIKVSMECVSLLHFCASYSDRCLRADRDSGILVLFKKLGWANCPSPSVRRVWVPTTLP